ncbi:uncharacterized protein K452DRAFT_302375 [Aplosporella prunicola CBS 121167]|uniref:Uncharacterized protein n=1 Tax=Aplosporella prunicola CBS 121167 TaxID=1176127 RepID=A0A6A6B1H3_9PEZI|nr:uncharacterized protein K452DRAFT_302375 [Aplosporella prunicola CBS 121167]KAF2136867.1 hypothetical protein K452DRAFT_302375 [Aplosporella prunicola CBS 121167]
MAGQPYNFAPDRVTSPFDRRPQSPFTSGQPPSFKTNINRNKTRKWVEAKAYNYDGDDWGDYDEDDEYGVAAHASTAPQPPAAFRKRGLSIGKNGQPRSFTEPSVAPGEPSSARRNSFEQGDEKRAFSASNAMPQSPPRINTTVLGGDVQPSANTMTVSPSVYSPATPATGPSTHHQPPHDATSQSRQSSWNQSVASDSSLFMDPHQRRDFEQSFLPQPLQMRGASPAPTSAPDPAAAQHFPPRKSSLSSPTDQRRPSFPQSGSSFQQMSPSSAPTPASPSKIVRPADIYKRLEETRQRERESMDSDRPSLDGLTSPVEDQRGQERGRPLRTSPLETVAERKSEYLPEFSLNEPEPQAQTAQAPAPVASSEGSLPALLPPVRPVSNFDTDFLRSADTHDASQASSTQATNTPEILAQANRQLPEPEVGPTGDAQLQHQPSLGFRSAVRDAFYRPDDNSVPPTPISKTDSLGTGASEVTRSDTTSTAGISPIMSRVPSGARPGGKKGKEPDYSHPSIAEEPGSRPVSIGTIRQVNRKPSPSTYNPETVPRVSTPTGRRNLGTPSPSHSPARSPAIAPAQNLPEPEAADLGMASPADADPASPKNFLTREADLASPSRSSGRTSQDAGAELRHAQTSFLEHRQSLSLDTSAPTSPISASESPTKGRVRDIANRLNADSRRNSTQSVTSVKSSGSGSKLHRSRSTSPVKRLPNDARPKPERASTFRPQLPGTWESFNTSVSDPATPSEAKSELDLRTPARPASTKTGQGPLEETDITPTTSKRPLDHKDAVDPAANPMGALAAAGAAMGEALKSAVGAGEKSEPQSWENSAASSAENLPVEEEKKDRSVGDVYLRPLQLDRKASSIESDSSVPPSPPADEQQTPSVEEEIRMPLPLKSREPSVHSEGEFLSARRPDIVTQLSTEPASYDTESDRLRKEIVARLSTPSLASENAEGARALSLSAQAAGPEGRTASPNNRVSIAIPTEYGDYWARYGDDDSLDRMPTHDSTHSAAAAPEHTVRPTMPDRSKTSTGSESTGAHNPLVKRFSWEQDSAATTPSAGAAPRVTLPTTELPAASKSPPTNQSSQEPDRSGNRASIAQAIAEMPDGRPISADGLHIINPEPESDSDVAELEAPAAPAQPHQPPGDLSLAASLEPALSATQTPPPASPAPTTPQAKVPLFREILALKSCDERVAKYNETREQFANMETGLRNWISSTLEKKPEHSHLISLPTQPLPPLTSGGGGGLGGMRHKHNKSLTTGLRKGSGMQGQFLDSSAANSAGSPTGQQVTSPGAPANKMQSKGKDLLKGAGVLGGKGMKEARGFFSKGRSKWRGSGADSKVD